MGYPTVVKHLNLQSKKVYNIRTRKNRLPLDVITMRSFNESIFHMYCMGESPRVIAKWKGEKPEQVERIVRMVAREGGMSLAQARYAHKQARSNMLAWIKKDRAKVLAKREKVKLRNTRVAKKKLAIRRNMQGFKEWLRKHPQ
ncbi:MAG: hypothetical protein WCW13_04680 [archaeon]|jgi:hypothetical protein